MLTDEERAIEELLYKERVARDKGEPTLRRPNVFRFQPFVPRTKRRRPGKR